MRKLSRFAESTLDVFGVKAWELLFYVSSYTAIAVFMMLGAFVACAGKPFLSFQCFNSWFLLPIFLVLVSATWIILSLSTVVTVMNVGKFASMHSKEN